MLQNSHQNIWVTHLHFLVILPWPPPHTHTPHVKCQRCKERAFPTQWDAISLSSAILTLLRADLGCQAGHAHSRVAGTRTVDEDVLCALSWCSVLLSAQCGSCHSWHFPQVLFWIASVPLTACGGRFAVWNTEDLCDVRIPPDFQLGSTTAVLLSCSGNSVMCFSLGDRSAAPFICRMLKTPLHFLSVPKVTWRPSQVYYLIVLGYYYLVNP